MAKGAIAKEKVAAAIAQAFGADYVGEFDKKLYVYADDGGERVQIAISLTCPKVFKGEGVENKAPLNFEDNETSAQATTFQPVEISEEENKTLEDLMARLGL